MTIKTLVHGLVWIVAGPLIAVAVYLLGASYAERRAAGLDAAATLADYAANEMRQIVSRSEAILAAAAARPLVRALDPASCDMGLIILRDVDPARANIAVIDRAGHVICSALAIPGGTLDVSDTEWFQRVLAENEFVVDKLHVARIIGRLVMVFAYPVRDERGAPVGAVVLPHELAKLRPLPDLASQPAGTMVTIVDREGKVVACQPQTDWVGRDVSDHAIVRTALAGGSGAAIGTSADGTEVAFAYRPIPSAGWVAIATIPTEVVFADARADAARTSAVVGVLLAVVFVLAATVIRRIVGPIERIAATSRAVAAGDLDARMPVPSQEEFAVVARQFNAMLEVRHSSEQRFSDLLENAPDGMLLVDSEARIRYANGQIEKMFGYARAELDGQSVELLVPERLRARHVAQRAGFECAPGPRAMGANLDLWARRKDGSEFAVDVSLSPIAMLDGPMTCCAVRDVTERQRAERRIKKLNRMYAALNRTGHAITRVADRQRLLDAVCRIAVEHGQLALAWIGFINPASGVMIPEARFGEAGAYVDGIRVSIDPSKPTGLGPGGRAVREGRPIVVADLMTDARFGPWREAARAHGLRSLAAFPLTEDGKPVGTINLYSHEVGYFDDPEIAQLLGNMAEELSFALEALGRDAARREAEERFRQIAENIREVFWLTDPTKGQMLYISPAYEAIWGRATAELYASPRSWADAIHPDDRARVHEAALTRQASGHYDEEYRVVRPDREVRWIHDRAFPVRDATGAVYRIAGFAEDITERKRAEDMLKRSEAGLAAAQTIAQLGSWERDLATGIATWSAEMCRLFGHDPTRPPPSFDEFVEQVHPDDRAAVRTHSEGLLHGAEGSVLEFRSNPARGPIRFFSARAATVKDAAGRIVKRTGTVLDITRLKEAEAKLVQAQKMEALGHFAGGIAHDFNNMLMPIRALTELSKADLPADSPVQENLDAILEAAIRASELVKQILAFSRYDVSQHAPIDISLCVAEALDLLGNVLPSTITLVREVAPDVGRILGDAAKIHSVILNLGANAVHAMNGKVGKLAVGLSRIVIDEELARRHRSLVERNACAKLTISDTGHGMDAATLERIFNPFFTTKPVGEGTGLGLAMVHSIIGSFGGAIEVSSAPDVGTTFEIYMPLQRDA